MATLSAVRDSLAEPAAVKSLALRLPGSAVIGLSDVERNTRSRSSKLRCEARIPLLNERHDRSQKIDD
jgi:hypothetical protein